MKVVRAVDLFCGAGGSSWGARDAGAKIVAGFDAWPLAGKTYAQNFPEASFHNGRLEDISNRQVKRLGSIDLLLASPECTNHSPAKGNKPRCEKSRETAFQVIRFAKILDPRWIVIENVVSMRNWSRYQELLDELNDLGYHIRVQTLNSADFCVPQRRRRLFVLCDKQQSPNLIRGLRKKPTPAKRIVDNNGTYRYSNLRAPGRAKATLERAKRAMKAVGKNKPFLIVYYGSDHAGGWQSIEAPLRTITTLDRFAYVKPSNNHHVMRMLQVPELKAAMGMAVDHAFDHGTRRDRIKMIGNAVCPPVMKYVINNLRANG